MGTWNELQNWLDIPQVIDRILDERLFWICLSQGYNHEAKQEGM